MEMEPTNINRSSPVFSHIDTGATTGENTPPLSNADRDATIGNGENMPKKGGVLKGLKSGLGKATGGVANLFKKHPMKATGLCIAIGAAVLVAGVALAGGPAGLVIAGALIAGGGIGLAVAGLFLEPGKGLYTKGDTRENQIMNHNDESSPTEGLSRPNPPPNERGVERAEEEPQIERSIPTDSPQVRPTESQTGTEPDVEVKPSVMDRIKQGKNRFVQWAGDGVAKISERWTGDVSEDTSSTSETDSSMTLD